MRLVYDYLFTALWIVFLAYWNLMAGRTKVTERMEPTVSRVLRAAAFLAAIVLLSFRFPVAWLNFQLWPQDMVTFWGGVALTLAGMLFCVWARLHLGRNWSRSVTIKQDHELIVTGPYALVRHPIYSGLYVAFLGAVLALGEPRALVAFALIAVSLWHKLRLEEKWMQAQFGAEYVNYSRQAAAVVPYML
jgi:protein-S-isoprenylcysteine O-methyltransferase Ste14